MWFMCSVLDCLPANGQRCFCFGYKTFCCKEDMDDSPEWHEVIFTFEISSYRLKKEIPIDIEESIIEEIKVIEFWEIYPISEDDNDHVIGVTKWKLLG